MAQAAVPTIPVPTIQNPPNLCDFCQLISLLMLHFVRRPIMLPRFTLGIRLPRGIKLANRTTEINFMGSSEILEASAPSCSALYIKYPNRTLHRTKVQMQVMATTFGFCFSVLLLTRPVSTMKPEPNSAIAGSNRNSYLLPMRSTFPSGPKCTGTTSGAMVRNTPVITKDSKINTTIHA